MLLVLSADVCSRPVKLREIKNSERLRRSGFTAPLREAGKEALAVTEKKEMGCFQRDREMYYWLVKCQIATLTLINGLWFNILFTV